MSYILALETCGPHCADLVGGKALGLGRLLSHGFQTPPGFAVTTNAYRDFLVASGLTPKITQALVGADEFARQQAASEEIRLLFEQAQPIPAITEEITAAYAHLCGDQVVPVAVRSSATAEDTTEASFAGQQETYLWIQHADAVVRNVIRCWASLFTPQAIAYRARLGIPVEEVAMGVVVQTMAPAEAAGVMITIDPVTGDRSQIAIEGSYGLGLAVVGGEVTPDRFNVDKVTLEIRSRELKAKEVAYRFDRQAGEVRLTNVPADEQSLPCITDEEAIAIATLGKRIERELGTPQDIEWAIGPALSGPRTLFLLQTRPETLWSQKRRDPIAASGTSVIDRVLDIYLRPQTRSDKTSGN